MGHYDEYRDRDDQRGSAMADKNDWALKQVMALRNEPMLDSMQFFGVAVKDMDREHLLGVVSFLAKPLLRSQTGALSVEQRDALKAARDAISSALEAG